MKVEAKKSDIAWNYIGTFVSMFGTLMLLPLLLKFLSDEEIGLWYVFVTISSFATLLEFGFNPTFARNITYVVSGATELNIIEPTNRNMSGNISYSLLKKVYYSCKFVYAAITVVALAVLSIIGTIYLDSVTKELEGGQHWYAWAVFVVATCVNLYFLYTASILRGLGDIAAENKAKTFGRISQIIVTLVLLMFGLGILGAAIGFFVNGLIIRVVSITLMRRHADLWVHISESSIQLSFGEILSVVKTVGNLAWRDGLVMVSNFCATQVTSLIASSHFGLVIAGTYSICLQISSAVVNVAGVYPKSFFPEFQAAFVRGKPDYLVNIVSRGLVLYWVGVVVASCGALTLGFKILDVVKPSFEPNYWLFMLITVYLAIWSQTGIFCNYIIAMNEIPYMTSFILTTFAGISLAFIMIVLFRCGIYALVIGPLVAHLLYNAWRWPVYLCGRISCTYWDLVKIGVARLKLSLQ